MFERDTNGVAILNNKAFDSKTLPDGKSLFKRCHGMGSLTLNAGETGDFEFQVPYPHAKMTAIEILDAQGAIEAELFVEDDDNGLYSGTGIPRLQLNQFGFEYNVCKDFCRSSSNFDADLYFGMWVVLQMTNNSASPITLRANIELNEVK